MSTRMWRKLGKNGLRFIVHLNYFKLTGTKNMVSDVSFYLHGKFHKYRPLRFEDICLFPYFIQTL